MHLVAKTYRTWMRGTDREKEKRDNIDAGPPYIFTKTIKNSKLFDQM